LLDRLDPSRESRFGLRSTMGDLDRRCGPGRSHLHRVLDFSQSALEGDQRLETGVESVETGVQLCESPPLDPTLRPLQEAFHGP